MSQLRDINKMCTNMKSNYLSRH